MVVDLFTLNAWTQVDDMRRNVENKHYYPESYFIQMYLSLNRIKVYLSITTVPYNRP